MDMTNINENTGLPVLPPNHYWRLIKDGSQNLHLVRGFLDYPSYPLGGMLLSPLGERSQVTGPFLLIEKEYTVPGKKTFFGKKEEPTVASKVVLVCGVVEANVSGLLPGEPEGPVPGVYVFPWSSVTPADVLRTATYMAHRLNERRRAEERHQQRRAAAEKLFGTYPPKSL